MRSNLWLAALVLVACGAAVAHGENLPEFQTRHAGKATALIVTDAKGKVLESWKGEFKVGDQLPEWLLKSIEIEQTIDWIGNRPKGAPKAVTGNRMVWFLRKDKQGNWEAAVSNFVPSSVAWIERGGVFAFALQLNNPGDLLMVPIASEEEFKKEALQHFEQGKRDRERGK